MCGLSSMTLLYLNAIAGMAVSQTCAIAIGIAASVVFATVDRYAVSLSSQLRRRAAAPATITQLTGVANTSRMEPAA
jgi:fucose permease